jgi:hypothetical protein
MTKKPPTPEMSKRVRAVPSASGATVPAPASTASDVADFVAKVKALGPAKGPGRGRLIFAMDATMSREPTWDMALALQADMFRAVEEVGGLDVQLVFFRGAGECRSSHWVSQPKELARLMTKVACHGGYTQIGKVLSHARAEAQKGKVNALVYVGDAMEESIDDLAGRAGELALVGVPVFLFQEGHDGVAAHAYKEIARLTKGAACHFDAGSASQLRELLTAVAVYAAGGKKALTALLESGRAREGARLLLAQMKPLG